MSKRECTKNGFLVVVRKNIVNYVVVVVVVVVGLEVVDV